MSEEQAGFRERFAKAHVNNSECLPLPTYNFGFKPMDPYLGVPVENAQQVLNYGEHLPLPQYSFGPEASGRA